MMLASNIPIKSKEDVIKTARCYLDRESRNISNLKTGI